MVQINGKYRLEKNENFVQYLIGLGVPEDKATQVNQGKAEIEIVISGNDVTITSNSNTSYGPYKWVLGKEIDEPMPFGVNQKSTATLNGDTLSIESKAEDGTTGQRIYKFSNSGFVLTLSSSKDGVSTATRTYVRI